MKIIIKNAELYNSNSAGKYDIIIDSGKIQKLSKTPVKVTSLSDVTVIDAAGLAVFPGLVDMHCHLREPGFEYKEDILSGTKAAAAGGFTSVACMPNTDPVTDNGEVVRYILARAAQCGYAKVYPIGAITKGSKGEQLTEAGELKESGAVALSDDGRPVENPAMMQNALLYAKSHGIPVISHCEDRALAADGVVNEGINSTISGLKGITRAAEDVMTAREVLLAESLNAPVHIAHVSTRGSVDIIRNAKKRGVAVSCETCPHYFSATDDYILNYDTNAKVNPPLRTHDDKQAIIEGIIDGTIDAIATDHAPHHADEKNVEFNYAANGISGFETAFSLVYTHLVKAGHITMQKLVELMSVKPGRLLGIGTGDLAEGGTADITIADLHQSYTVDSSKFFSKGKNTPFDGQTVTGKIIYTLINGEIKYFAGRQ